MRGEELLQAVCADPSDIESRLVYADWLLEQGDPRGAFITQHCQLERMTGLEDEYPALLASTRRLEAAHVPEWLSEYAARNQVEPGEYGRIELDQHFNAVFRHGFLQRIAMRPDQISSEWEWLRQREPIQGIELLVSEILPKPQRELEQPKSWRTLKVSPDGWFYVNSIGDVLRWGLGELRELDLSRCDAGADGCRLIAGLETTLKQHFEDWIPPPPFEHGQLERLALHGCKIGDEGARVLCGAAALSSLTELAISQCGIAEAATLEALRESTQLSKLLRLALSGNNALAGKLGALAGWPVLAQLEFLSLPQACGVDEIEALFPLPSDQLRELDLSSAKQLMKTPARVVALARSLTLLDIGTSYVGDAGFGELLRAPSLATLVELRANGCSLSDKAIIALTESALKRLVALDLSSNKLTDAGLQALAQWPGLEHVTHLRIGNNKKLGLAGYQALCEADQFQPVRLDIGRSGNAEVNALLAERYGGALYFRGA